MFNFDFGPVNGNIVKLSTYGLAVKNASGVYVSYDAKSESIMDVDILNFDGSQFLYKMPVALTDIKVNDVVVHEGKPMFVCKVNEKTLNVVDPVAGDRKEIMLTRSPFGFNFATKIVNFLGDMFGDFNANEDSPFGNIWMFFALNGEMDMNTMLPLMFMGKEGGDFDPMMLLLMGQNGNKKGGLDTSMLPWLYMMKNKPAATKTAN